jgi:hypothetical protein
MALVLVIPAARSFAVVILVIALVVVSMFVVAFSVSVSVPLGKREIACERKKTYSKGNHPSFRAHLFLSVPKAVGPRLRENCVVTRGLSKGCVVFRSVLPDRWQSRIDPSSGLGGRLDERNFRALSSRRVDQTSELWRTKSEYDMFALL